MKKILLVLLLSPFLSLAQGKQPNCDKLIKTTHDKVENKSFRGLNKKIMVASSGKILFIDFHKNEAGDIYLLLNAGPLSGCVDTGSKIIILFTDATKIELQNLGGIDCGRTPAVQAGFSDKIGNLEQFEMFKTKKIDVIRIHTDKSYADISFNESRQRDIIEVANCL